MLPKGARGEITIISIAKDDNHGNSIEFCTADGRSAQKLWGCPAPAAAPCLLRALFQRSAGAACAHFEITVLYYNPNTWPAEEYHRRGESWSAS